MKEKIGIIFIVVLAAICLFGCSKELPEEEMVWQQCSDIIL